MSDARAAIEGLLAVAAALPESPPRPAPIPPPKPPPKQSPKFDSAKADAWNQRWQERYAPEHAAFRRPHSRYDGRGLNPAHPSVQVVLTLERQINNGKQLSAVPGEEK